MDAPSANSCPNCELSRKELAALRERVVALEARLAAATKNSANSSKPPSSDIVKPPRQENGKGRKGKRKRGGQRGHQRHERPPFAEAEIDQRVEYAVDTCPDCGCPTVATAAPPQVVQQVEIVEKPITITEHRGVSCLCPCCGKTFVGEIPREVRRAGLVGPRLTALVGFLKGGCHCSFSTIRKFLRDVVGVTISRAHLRNLCGKVADSLESAYDELLALLPHEPRLNVDETGHREYSDRLWTWCFRAATFTLFKIDPSRGSQVLLDVLGEEFAGVLGCDYFSAYRKYMADFGVLVQFCLAHLLRDIRFLAEHPHPRTQAYGKRLVTAARELFHVIHCRAEYSEQNFAIALQNAGDELHAQALDRIPGTNEAQNLANRFRKHGESYLRFITTPGIEPTNNLAEQAIRFVVIDRLVTQGTRGKPGRRWSERIWTTMATCAQHGQSAFNFLVETVQAHFQGCPTPSLLPNTS
jgi:transposase